MAIVGEDGVSAARVAVKAGVDLVQVRAKMLPCAALLRLVRAVVGVVGDPRRVLVNGRPDIASITRCGGVHLPERGLKIGAVRASFPDLIIGASRHDRAGVIEAEAEGADYVVLGPVFETPGKGPFLGIEGFGTAAAAVHLPVIAVGGISAGNADAVLAAGAAGVAAIRSLAGVNASLFVQSLKALSKAD